MLNENKHHKIHVEKEGKGPKTTPQMHNVNRIATNEQSH